MKSTQSTFMCLTLMCTISLFGQEAATLPQILRTPKQSIAHTPIPEAPMGLKKIYGNLGPRKNAYEGTKGYIVSGRDSVFGFAEFIGMSFVPKKDSTVQQVQIAIQYIGPGSNQVNVSLYSNTGDPPGIPGTRLAGPVTVKNLPLDGTCCELTIVSFAAGVAVKGGEQYWVVADAPASGTGSDFAGRWEFVLPIPPVAYNTTGGWTSSSNDLLLPAGAVFGTIP